MGQDDELTPLIGSEMIRAQLPSSTRPGRSLLAGQAEALRARVWRPRLFGSERRGPRAPGALLARGSRHAVLGGPAPGGAAHEHLAARSTCWKGLEHGRKVAIPCYSMLHWPVLSPFVKPRNLSKDKHFMRYYNCGSPTWLWTYRTVPKALGLIKSLLPRSSGLLGPFWYLTDL